MAFTRDQIERFKRAEQAALQHHRDLVARDDTDEFRVQPPADLRAQIQVVRVKSDGGSAGGPTTQCSFTYAIYPDVADITGVTELAIGLTPEKARTPTGECVAAPDGSRGLAYQFDGSWVLLEALGEVNDTEDC